MGAIKFLEHVLAQGQSYCIFAVNGGSGQRLITQKFLASMDEMDELASTLDESDNDVYFALASFVTPGKRTADNAEKLRSFFLDLDCGKDKGDKGFPTQQAAVKAVRVFCQTHQLPKPTMVNSGRGLHVYWAMDEDLAKDDWLPLAVRFKQMCLNHGLNIDPVVSADCARVLRYPGTRNHKDSPPKNVAVLADLEPAVSLDKFKAILDHYVPEGVVPPKKTRSNAADPMMASLMGNSTSRFKTILEKSAKGRGCAQLAYAAANQEEVEEPLWRAALSIAVNCIDGEKAIHVISKRHSEYDPEVTRAKANKTSGPHHCTTFDAINPGLCGKCPHKGKITSPIQLGREIIRAQEEDNVVFDRPEQMKTVELQSYTIPKYPSPYFRGKNGGVYVQSTDREGDSVEMLVYEHDLYVLRRTDDPEDGASLVVRVHLPYDGVKEFTIPLTAATSRDELRKYLSKNSVAVATTAHWDALMTYILKWESSLENTSAADVSRRQFGWADDNFSSFTLGRARVLPDRVELNAPSTKTSHLFPMFEPQGSLDEWKKNLEFFNKPGFESYQYIIGTAFGSVLTKMTAIKGSIFHFHSKDSGYGKTTVLLAAASLWADPAKFVKFERDTYHDKMNYAETLKDLPLYCDEMTNMQPKEASDFIYQIPSGKQRGRLSQGANSSRWRGDPWSFICVTTGNMSLISKVNSYKDAPKAEAQRVLEFSPQKHKLPKQDTDELAKSIERNFGHAAIPYLQYIMNNLDEVQKLLVSIQLTIDTRAGLAAENRFWSAQAACDITGLLIAKRLKFIDFDVRALLDWVVDYLRNYKREDVSTHSQDATHVVSDYFYAHVNDFLRIRNSNDGRLDANGRPDVLDHLVVPEAMPKNALLGRLETDTNTLFLMPKPFRLWCAERQVDFNEIVKELRTLPCGAKTVSKRMGKGTKLNLPPVSVLKLKGASWLSDAGTEDEIISNNKEAEEE
jgi:hypothetical protein